MGKTIITSGHYYKLRQNYQTTSTVPQFPQGELNVLWRESRKAVLVKVILVPLKLALVYVIRRLSNIVQ